jgi:site-specific recombinase XerC
VPHAEGGSDGTDHDGDGVGALPPTALGSWHTIDQVSRHVQLLAAYLPEHRPDEITHEDIAVFFNSTVATRKSDGRAKRPTSMNCLRSSLRTFFSYLLRAGYIERDPTVMLRLARTGVAPPRGISDRERNWLFAAIAADGSVAARRDEMLFGLLLASGIRISSALALDVGDLDPEDCSLVLHKVKGGVPQRAYLPREVMARLLAFVGNRARGAVFRGRAGERLGARQAHRRLAEWCTKAGIARRVSPHSLRHAFALSLYERTGDVLLVQGALGHRSIMSTTIYARASGERVRAAVCGR